MVDQVYVFIPVEDAVTKKDVDALFEAKSVSIKINGKDAIEFECIERVIPDGCFWTFEEDEDQRYIQLDMEKRFRMINWKGLFSENNELPPSPGGSSDNFEDQRNAMLEKLMAANKGISELTGTSPESIDDMMENPDLYSMLNNDVNTSPTIVDDDGTEVAMGLSDAEEDLERAFREAVEEAAARDDGGDNGEGDVIDVEEVK